MSFMHEVDAASVPPHFLPNDPTLANYLGFVNPSTDQALVGSNAIGDTPYALLNSMVVALSTALVNLVLGTFAAYSFSRHPVPRQPGAADRLPAHADGAGYRDHHPVLPRDAHARPAGHVRRADPVVHDVRAADHDLDPEGLLPVGTAGTGGRRPGGPVRLVPHDVEGVPPDLRARARGGGDLLVHDGVERVHVRAVHDQQHQRRRRSR